MKWIRYKKRLHRLTTIIPGCEYRLAIPEERSAVTADRVAGKSRARTLWSEVALNNHAKLAA
jgi:hypothetical protein